MNMIYAIYNIHHNSIDAKFFCVYIMCLSAAFRTISDNPKGILVIFSTQIC